METVPHGTFLRSKQTVTVTIEFLNWLNDHGITLAELQQEHLDAWLADGPSTRRFVDRFIPWAIKCRLVDAELSIARHRRGTSPKLPKSEQDAAVERVVHTDELTARDRAAAILARLGTLHELTKLGPVPIIADALGYHPSTIERHAIGSASTYAEYIAAARELRQTS